MKSGFEPWQFDPWAHPASCLKIRPFQRQTAKCWAECSQIGLRGPPASPKSVFHTARGILLRTQNISVSSLLGMSWQGDWTPYMTSRPFGKYLSIWPCHVPLSLFLLFFCCHSGPLSVSHTSQGHPHLRTFTPVVPLPLMPLPHRFLRLALCHHADLNSKSPSQRDLSTHLV